MSWFSDRFYEFNRSENSSASDRYDLFEYIKYIIEMDVMAICCGCSEYEYLDEIELDEIEL